MCLIAAFHPLDSFSLSVLRLCYICHYSVCNGDTWASELGSVFGGVPVLVTSLRKVPPGTNGGITILGLGASFLGGSFVAVCSQALSGILKVPPVFGSVLQAAAVGGLFGFVGSFV